MFFWFYYIENYLINIALFVIKMQTQLHYNIINSKKYFEIKILIRNREKCKKYVEKKILAPNLFIF